MSPETLKSPVPCFSVSPAFVIALMSVSKRALIALLPRAIGEPGAITTASSAYSDAMAAASPALWLSNQVLLIARIALSSAATFAAAGITAVAVSADFSAALHAAMSMIPALTARARWSRIIL